MTFAAVATIAGGALAAGGSILGARSQAKSAKAEREQEQQSIDDLRRIRERLTNEALGGDFLGRFGLNEIFGRRPEQVDLRGSIGRSALLNEDILRLNQGLAGRTNQAISEDALRRAGTFDPNFRTNISNLSESARRLIQGDIPTDVIESVRRARAEQGAGGFGGGVGNQRAATARDLGLTSLDLQNRGAGIFQQINAARDAMDPISRQVSLNQFLLTPEQQIQADIANIGIRSSADPAAQRLFEDQYRGLREEATARGQVGVPVDNTLGAGLSAGSGFLSGLLESGFFSDKKKNDDE